MPKPLKRYPITYAGNGGAADSRENPTIATTDAAGTIQYGFELVEVVAIPNTTI